MFVLLFGLMGVAAIFPVGNFYVVEGEKFDLGGGLAQNAFEELKARGMLRPEVWFYGNSTNASLRPFMDTADGSFVNDVPAPFDSDIGPGHAFVIDPMGAANVPQAFFPFSVSLLSTPYNHWLANPYQLHGTDWPVRRITVLQTPGVLMSAPVAETIFRLRDDLAVEQPDESDRPSIQRWDADNNGTPNDLTDDILLRRQYKGDYSWLATIVPTTGAGLAALQPASADYGEISYDVSVVVFRKRDDVPSVTSERLIEAELLQGGELVIYSSLANTTDAKAAVDAAVDDIRPGNWISLMGVNRTTGDFVMKWYRLLTLDRETTQIDVITTRNPQQARRAMLIGPDWPAPPAGVVFIGDLRAGIFPGAISVVTKPLKMEDFSLWKME